MKEAQLALEETRLLTPFAGIVGRKLVDDFAQVGANQTLVVVQNLQQLEVMIQVPDKVVLLLFMGLRVGVIIGFGLLLTVAGTLIDDIAMQRVSLGALIIALGMLVDNAIVVSDGVLVRMQQGEERQAAISAVVRGTSGR